MSKQKNKKGISVEAWFNMAKGDVGSDDLPLSTLWETLQHNKVLLQRLLQSCCDFTNEMQQ